MDKYLKQLLETHAKVILPSFGAIVVENEDTGNLMFNEYLSYNDGKLDDLIVSESNMELQEAQNMIAKYIRDIQVEIDKGESYDIFELGRFFKNQDGDIEFEGNLKDGPKKQSKSDSSKAAGSKSAASDKKKEEAPKPKEEKKESKPEPKKEESKADPKAKEDTKTDSKSTQKENKFVAKKEKDEANANKAKSKSDANKKKEEAQANKAKLKAEAKKKKEEAKANKAKLKAEEKKKKAEAKKGAKSSDKTKAPDKTEKIADKAKSAESAKVNKVKNEKSPKDQKNPKDPKKKKRFGAFFWIVMIILALASAGLIYVGLNYEQVKTYMGWDKFEDEGKVTPKEPKDEAKEADEDQEPIEFDATGNTASDSTEASNVVVDDEGDAAEEKQEVEETPAPEPEPSPVTTSSNGTHHLIAGSFSVKSNAVGLVKDLKSKGLNARIIGQFGGLHFVAAESYNSSKEAQADLSRVRQQAEGAWIFKYNDN
jgi:hypothetical protein